jgi:quinol monooxygenase YgiN
MTVWLTAEFTAKQGCEEELAEMLERLTVDVRAEPGNLVFIPLVLQEDPRRHVVIEQYRDEAAFQAHLAAPYGAVFNRRLVELIEEPCSALTFLTPTGG